MSDYKSSDNKRKDQHGSPTPRIKKENTKQRLVGSPPVSSATKMLQKMKTDHKNVQPYTLTSPDESLLSRFKNSTTNADQETGDVVSASKPTSEHTTSAKGNAKADLENEKQTNELRNGSEKATNKPDAKEDLEEKRDEDELKANLDKEEKEEEKQETKAEKSKEKPVKKERSKKINSKKKETKEKDGDEEELNKEEKLKLKQFTKKTAKQLGVQKKQADNKLAQEKHKVEEKEEDQKQEDQQALVEKRLEKMEQQKNTQLQEVDSKLNVQLAELEEQQETEEEEQQTQELQVKEQIQKLEELKTEIAAALEGKKEQDPEKASLKEKMEKGFNTDFSNVKIVKSSPLAKQIGAKAFTKGDEIHFAPGEYNPESEKGKKLLGHELAHVVQQRKGQVKPTGKVGGMDVNKNPKLEKEADILGDKAVNGELNIKGANSKNNNAGVVQGKFFDWMGGLGEGDDHESSQVLQLAIYSSLFAGQVKPGLEMQRQVNKTKAGRTFNQWMGEISEGAIYGDLIDDEDKNWKNIAGQTAISFVPYAGQVADARDLSVAINKMGDGGWKKKGNWGNLGLAGLGFIPGVGDVAKNLKHVPWGGLGNIPWKSIGKGLDPRKLRNVNWGNIGSGIGNQLGKLNPRKLRNVNWGNMRSGIGDQLGKLNPNKLRNVNLGGIGSGIGKKLGGLNPMGGIRSTLADLKPSNIKSSINSGLKSIKEFDGFKLKPGWRSITALGSYGIRKGLNGKLFPKRKDFAIFRQSTNKLFNTKKEAKALYKSLRNNFFGGSLNFVKDKTFPKGLRNFSKHFYKNTPWGKMENWSIRKRVTNFKPVISKTIFEAGKAKEKIKERYQTRKIELGNWAQNTLRKPSFGNKLKRPKFKLPKFKRPKLPKFKRPKMGRKFSKFKKRLPKFKRPKFRRPKFGGHKFSKFKKRLPKFKRPKFRRPKVNKRKFSRFKKRMPKFKRPKFRKPKFKRPKFKRPKFKRPKLRRNGSKKVTKRYYKARKKVTKRFQKVRKRFTPRYKKARKRVTSRYRKVRSRYRKRRRWRRR